MDKPSEIHLIEIKSNLEAVEKQGDFNENLMAWIKNRNESGPRDEAMMVFSKFVVSSFDRIKLLLSILDAGYKKPMQTHLIECADAQTLQHMINQFLLTHPMSENPSVTVTSKIGGGYFCVITGRFDTQFSDYIQHALSQIGAIND